MDKLFLGLVVVFFIAFTAFVSFFAFKGPILQVTRASSQDTKVSANDSLLFAWPLTVPADGKTTSTVTVFVRNSSTQALSSKDVSIQASLGHLKEATVITDADGKAEFHLSSDQSGVAEIQAIVDNIKIPKTISVSFE